MAINYTVLHAEAGSDLSEPGPEYIGQQNLECLAGRYHTPLDETGPDRDLRGRVPRTR
ncbi:MAG TPA: hypothetical protein VFG48_03485 [Xanthomonadales bacterium]|nr:hypothetical protein [Xanthomonadales bacterium]